MRDLLTDRIDDLDPRPHYCAAALVAEVQGAVYRPHRHVIRFHVDAKTLPVGHVYCSANPKPRHPCPDEVPPAAKARTTASSLSTPGKALFMLVGIPTPSSCTVTTTWLSSSSTRTLPAASAHCKTSGTTRTQRSPTPSGRCVAPKPTDSAAGYVSRRRYRDGVYRRHAFDSLGMTLLLDVIIVRSMIFMRPAMASSFGKGSEVTRSRVAHCQ